MQVDVTPPSNPLPSTHRHNFTQTILFLIYLKRHTFSVPRGPPNHPPSNEPIIVLEQLKELKTQMFPLQQMHSYLIQNLIDRAWPPLAMTQSIHDPFT